MTIWQSHFPLAVPRKEQGTALDFIVDAIQAGKKWIICELPVGVGKSAVAIALARWVNANVKMTSDSDTGAYILTPQKILQDQYVKDFGGNGTLVSLKSATNYQCGYAAGSSCGESRRFLKTMEKQLKGSEYQNHCKNFCPYSQDKEAFINSPLGVTNFSYFLAETMYAKKIKPRQLLIIDEAHNAESELSKFIEINFSERFARDVMEVKPSKKTDPESIFAWVKTKYRPALLKKIKKMEGLFEAAHAKGEQPEPEQTKQYETMDQHICKVNRFINHYDINNWVMTVSRVGEGKKATRKFQFKPVNVAPYSDDYLFKFGDIVLMMSGTIIDYEIFCRDLGIPTDKAAFLSLTSPFPVENRPIHYLPVGKMAMNEIQQTLPKMTAVLKDLLQLHKDEKGIIHCNSFKIVNHFRDNLKDGRLLVQDDKNREAILQYHCESEDPTVLVSPSMTEGVDLRDDLSRFQIICKVPFPYLGDEWTQKRMKRDPKWYAYMTAKTIMQAYGRSVRNQTDHAITYILDQSWEQFYRMNRELFPQSFKDALN